MTDERKKLCCPVCNAEEIEAYTPRTVYACGSSDYDQRPGTFRKGDNCKLKETGVEESKLNRVTTYLKSTLESIELQSKEQGKFTHFNLVIPETMMDKLRDKFTINVVNDILVTEISGCIVHIYPVKFNTGGNIYLHECYEN